MDGLQVLLTCMYSRVHNVGALTHRFFSSEGRTFRVQTWWLKLSLSRRLLYPHIPQSPVISSRSLEAVACAKQIVATMMSGEAWLYLLSVLINAVNLFLQVFFTIMYSDLEWWAVFHCASRLRIRPCPVSACCLLADNMYWVQWLYQSHRPLQ